METEVAIEAEYKDNMVMRVEQELRTMLPEYTRNIVVVVKIVKLK